MLVERAGDTTRRASAAPPAGTPPPAESAAFAADTLELGAVRDLLARHTSFSAGRERALALAPTADLDEARRWQAETTEALRLPGLRPSLHLGGVHDVRPAAERAAVGGVLRPHELLDVSSTVRGARAWRHGLRPLAEELPVLVDLAESCLQDHSGLAEDIQAAISENAEVLDTASPALARVRAELRGAHGRLVARLRELMGQPPFRDAVQDPVVTERAGRYVIPIRAEARGSVPAIVHDQSASGATLFVEPLAVVEMANRWRELRLEEEREVERILGALSRAVGDAAESLARSVEGLARLDLARAKAALADEQHATAPELVGLPRRAGEPVLRLVQARHPLLLAAHGEQVVPQTIELGGAFDVLLITGPNTGGKTVALKTAGLLTLMAQAGLHVPAEDGSLVAVFQRVHADIGDEQSLQQSLSTFSSHVTRIVRMLHGADSQTLVLLDELGAGTDPQEGAALARALLDFLRARGTYVIATSHYPELKTYARVTERVENASVEFDVETLSPTYRLQIGLPGRSNAIAIARRLGMPEEVLRTAQANVAPQAAEVETLLQEIARERADAEDARRRALSEAAEAASLKHRLRTQVRSAEQQHDELWTRVQQAAEEELAELRREAHRVRLQLQMASSRRGRGEAREAVDAALSLRGLERPAAPALPQPEPAAEDENVAVVEVGAEVLVPRLGGIPGRVLAVRDGEVELDVLGRRVRVKREELEGAPRATAADHRRAEARPRRAQQHVVLATERGDLPLQLDLRGLRVEEALERLEGYLHEAALAGLSEARIVHGKGTGAVRSAVREALRSSSLVQRFASEPDAQGGDGATTVWLRG